ncbi:hypothetical protein SODALDRAFT_90681 [Sodiomyces alkalinus F11]|uniref:Uncharacterized protein n=1 Tax=Sodiomyces alkalinus (strain CBS 110278 / VKM F-3762 / F11) TaxID=1314773 RepID=A0A3N2Q0Q5_SODAK|nr:hypothetical protein SODALDRAFT_90681 [Sodiomyces alkalinus F11]ROT40195.1 hypothetical protein SODALDRAFT_90681 [Sodiomyces alkalinus F11]
MTPEQSIQYIHRLDWHSPGCCRKSSGTRINRLSQYRTSLLSTARVAFQFCSLVTFPTISILPLNLAPFLPDPSFFLLMLNIAQDREGTVCGTPETATCTSVYLLHGGRDGHEYPPSVLIHTLSMASNGHTSITKQKGTILNDLPRIRTKYGYFVVYISGAPFPARPPSRLDPMLARFLLRAGVSTSVLRERRPSKRSCPIHPPQSQSHQESNPVLHQPLLLHTRTLYGVLNISSPSARSTPPCRLHVHILQASNLRPQFQPTPRSSPYAPLSFWLIFPQQAAWLNSNESTAVALPANAPQPQSN